MTPKGGAPLVLQVMPTLSTPADRVALDLAEALRHAGGAAVVASSGGPLVAELARSGASHVALPLDRRNPIAIRGNAARLARLVAEQAIDILHARGRSAAWPAYLAARRARRPFVATVDRVYRRRGAIGQFYAGVLARADRVIAVSNFVAEDLREHYGVDDRRLRLVRRGIDLLRFDPTRMTAERVMQQAQQWRLPDGLPIVMLPAPFSAGGGQRALLAALALLRGREFHALLLDPGGGEEGEIEAIEAEIGLLGLAGRAQIARECRDMPAAYMLADVVVQAGSEPAAFLPAIAEAQAMGRPAVALALGGAVEQLSGAAMAWLVEPGRPQALADAVGAALALTIEERQALAPEAARRARLAYNKQRTATDTLAVYRELLEAPHWRAANAARLAMIEPVGLVAGPGE
jgi:glycosyltransferase involved in cell wall biosynthesis